jgi:predicted AlkP superfamily pyrophosphatase or phosphodiesterase
LGFSRSYIGLFLCLILAGGTALTAHESTASATVTRKILDQKPRLIVVVVGDQLRSDYLTRHRSRLLPAKDKKGRVGGFRYLTDLGSYYPIAHYKVARALTGPGHATLATGAYAYRHGIVANWFFNPVTQRSNYSTGDPKHRPINASPWSAKRGTSPSKLRGPTLGDSLKNSGSPSKVVSVAMKDRAAILMGGFRADTAIWFDYKVFRWVSSTYYYPNGKLPGWLTQVNRKIGAMKGKTLSWDTQGKGSGKSDVGPKAGFRKTFRVGTPASLESPLGHSLTVDAALAATDAHKLGQDEHPDILWVSFSVLDYLGHELGPNRREMEELFLAMDAALSRLFNSLAARVPGGLADISIILTGDHGITPAPSYLKARKVPTGHIDKKATAAQLENHLSQVYGPVSPMKWVSYTGKGGYHLNRRVLARLKLPLEHVASQASRYLEVVPGVAHVFNIGDYYAKRFPPGLPGQQIKNSFFPGRSPDVMFITRPYFTTTRDPIGHLSGYHYDTSVPLIFKGRHIRAAVHAQHAEITDIAPTLAFLLGIVPPALSEGRVLQEIFLP